MSTYDLIIRNGTVVDGSGLDAFRADVGIVGDRIVKVGRIGSSASETIDAAGCIVTPGFIDVHTHLDAQIFWDSVGANSCWHGVTTAVMGNCGFTVAPGSRDQRGLLVRNLERAEDIAAEAMDAGIDWTWTGFKEYLDVLDALPKGINYVTQVGHSALRCHVMGERAFTEPATQSDLELMANAARDAWRAGAWGLSTSRTRHHQTPDGGPVASRLADWREVDFLLRAVSELGDGMYQYVEDPQPDAAGTAAREMELIALAAETGLTFVIGASGKPEQVIPFIERGAAAGARIVGVTHPRGIGNWSSFHTRTPFDRLPVWAELRATPIDEQRRLLADPATRQALVDAARNAVYVETSGAEARPPDFDRMRVMMRSTPPWPTVAELAAARGLDPVEAVIEVALESDLDVFFVQPLTPYDHEQVRTLLAHPSIVMGFSDSGAHVSQMADASITTHLLAHWVREREELTIEQAVRMLSFEPARAWGLDDRGLVRAGLIADLNVIDPLTVGPRMPRVVRDLPAGLPRIEQRADGIRATIVNGLALTIGGEHTGAHPGRVLRRAR